MRSSLEKSVPVETHASAERPVLPFPVLGGLSQQSGSSVLWSALRRAGDEVAAQLEPVVERNGGSAYDLEAAISSLRASVRQVVRRREPRLRHGPASIPVRRCLDLLRRAFLAEVRRVEGEADQDALLDVLEAFERVGECIDQDCTERFVANLSGPSALDLLVEVAHDMRSPLGSILFLVETLRDERSGAVTAIQERQLGLVYNAAFALSSVTNDLTELARGCDRLVDVRPVPFSLAEVFRAVGDIVQPIAEEKKLTVELSPPVSTFRLGHPAALHRVLLNLTTNALKFTSAGVVRVAAAQRGRTGVEFAVTDTGAGIPPHVMETLFETFRPRQKPGEYHFSSAGLGLSICRKLVEAMGGQLRVESAQGKGTQFSFHLDLPIATAL
jgi:signal transduction histidine kinase